ncbi:MAG: hypothetical protein IMY72_12030 [Bacteroidetes bacterium]|nr:hypothetical protein [Bacteroidota bacterium]
MKIIVKFFGIIIAILLLIYLVGIFLPKNILIKRQILIEKPFFIVWSDLTNPYEEPNWRQDIDTIIQLEDIDGNAVWKETYNNGDSIILETTTNIPNVLIARSYVNDNNFEGTRIVNIKKTEKGTFVRIVLEGKVTNAIYRLKNLISNKENKRLGRYLHNLKNKYKNEVPEEDAW